MKLKVIVATTCTVLCCFVPLLCNGKSQVQEFPLTIIKSPVLIYKRLFMDKNNCTETSIPFVGKTGKLRFCIKNKTLFLDRNLDGKIDDKDLPGILSGRRDSIMVEFGGKKIKYPFAVGYVDDKRAVIWSDFAVLAKINDKKCFFCDANFNGRIGDIGEDTINFGKAHLTQVVLAENILLDNNIYKLNIDTKTKQLKITKYQGKTSKLILKVASSKCHERLVLQHVDNKLNCVVSTDKASTLLPGRYKIALGIYAETKEATTHYDFDDIRSKKEAVYFVLKGGCLTINNNDTQELKVGEPFNLKIIGTRPVPNQLVLRDIELVLHEGSITHAANCAGVRNYPPVVFLSLNGEEKRMATLEYG